MWHSQYFFSFLDDIKITVPYDTNHIQRINRILERLEEYNLRMNFEKSEFMKDSITYCGYIINKDGIQRMQTKIDAIKKI